MSESTLPSLSSLSAPRIADRLRAGRRGRFVGREAELELFRSTLLAAEPPFAVLHIYGPGGVGKSTLLREYARLATEAGRPVILLERDVEPSPPGFRLALRRTMGLEDSGAALPLAQWPSNAILMIDTYEVLATLDGWLREAFLPQLPADSLVVIAGRNPPAADWRTDIAWAELTRILSLRNLRPEESQTYLTVRGIPDDKHPEVLASTHGHPLALSLVADFLSQRNPDQPFSFQAEPDTVRVLLERFVQDVPSPNHRLGLQVCSLAWATTENLLAVVIEREEAPHIFEWLRSLSFIEQGPKGLFPHDLARDLLDADFRWRNPTDYRQVNQRLTEYMYTWLLQAGGGEQQRIWYDILFLARHNPFMKPYFDWNTFHSVYAEPATPADHDAILAMVQAHQGEASAEVAQYWVDRQPEAFRAFRSMSGELIGFMANLSLQFDDLEESAGVDLAIAAALNFTRRYGPVRPDEEIIYLRFWMHREIHQYPSPALNLTAINSTISWTTRPKLAWNFIATAVPDFLYPHFAIINMRRSPEAEFDMGGHRFGVFSHDWRVEPPTDWLTMKAERYQQTNFSPEQMEADSPPPLLVLSQPEFEEAVRQALRDYTRPDMLASNPLMRSRLVVEAAETPSSPATLQSLLRGAAEALTGNPKDEKLYRAIYQTYLEPAPTQEQAAERLDLPFNTYRYHLSNGLKRVTAWLWQKEVQ